MIHIKQNLYNTDMRQSTVNTEKDSEGNFELEIFDHSNPKQIIVCAHGNGVRRWDGEKFFYQVAEYFTDSVVMLVDQNQQLENGVKSNPLHILVARVQRLITIGSNKYPDVPIVIIAHSMGCGVTTQLDLTSVNNVIFVTPATGNIQKSLISRYGNEIKTKNKVIITPDGYTKIFTPGYYNSMNDIVWEKEYLKLCAKFSPIHVFEAGDEEIVGEERFTHREMPFTSYTVLKDANHNLTGQPLKDFFIKVDSII